MSILGGSQFKDLNGKTHYQNNKLYYIQKNRRLAKRNAEFIRDYKKTHSCVDCDNSDHRVLEFDHLRNKKFNVSSMVRCYSIEKIKEEIGKCDIVCANCHRIRTWKRIH